MMDKKDITEKLEPLYDKKVECLLCGQEFVTKKIRSRFIKPRKVDSDFGQIFEQDDNSPLFYYVMVCPHCGFSFTEDFSKIMAQNVRKKTLEEISGKMDHSKDFCGERDYQMAVRTFKLAIYFAQLIKEKHVVLARICHRLAWIYRGAGIAEEEMRFMNLACTEYEQSFLYTDFNPELTPEIQILYLIGELNRRLGKYNEAVKYFSTVSEHPDKSRYMKYVNMARNQWSEAVQEYRESKNKQQIQPNVKSE
ncbi:MULTISPECIES: DUF2225 domain-containing protein [Dehalobacter]|jgi:hypothetical protein|uniref:DUF2225 domain-containing protein n=3 Tax=Dehalobacter TaxID=56112 RepID=A0A857DMW6_9FIRM|nr:MULTISPECIES: DUF2225 domain-containing protein [Dehalobacter]AHF11110.1 hypothetical protein DEHRE_14385 [Dehalobacter restrictus DSM 9455]MCG1024630.1 DUF2225 domain-containing protein [Dehalobacter sp.]MDJ0305257.1 DUF2225 domain-containing protein [Dehalobacter sp.]OCZ53974.1 hypothetical protein A7D23_06655 [Dehalobacter sp. TeCB1]QHA01762.1 DUF2225 domain-containing protein [Dehalobacter restrictus]